MEEDSRLLAALQAKMAAQCGLVILLLAAVACRLSEAGFSIFPGLVQYEGKDSDLRIFASIP
jgi:hypothetical protein